MNTIKSNLIIENWILVDKILFNNKNKKNLFKNESFKNKYLETKSLFLLNLLEFYNILKLNNKVNKLDKIKLNEKVNLTHNKFSKLLKETNSLNYVNLLDTCTLFRKDVIDKIKQKDVYNTKKYRTMIETHRQLRNELIALVEAVKEEPGTLANSQDRIKMIHKAMPPNLRNEKNILFQSGLAKAINKKHIEMTGKNAKIVPKGEVNNSFIDGIRKQREAWKSKWTPENKQKALEFLKNRNKNK